MNRDDIGRWVVAYERAWRTPGTTGVATLFTEDATYLTSPWADPVVGLPALETFWEEGREEGEQFTMSWSVLAVDGATAVVRVFVEYANPTEPWRDLWVLTFAEDGRCSAFEEWPFAPKRAG